MIVMVAAAVMMLPACTTVRPGEVGVDIHYGKVKDKILKPGLHHPFALFGKRIERFSTREINYSIAIDFHTKEGIDVKSEITVLYHVSPDSVKNIYNRIGREYQATIIKDNIIAAIRQIGLNYKTTELISQRSAIERGVKDRLTERIGLHGFEVHSVMLKQIDLPSDIEQTIRAQLNAEESAKKVKFENEVNREQLAFQLERSKKEKQQEIDNQRMQLDFNVERQRKENERLILEAEAVAKQQELLKKNLSDLLIRYKSLEVTKELIKSTNAKLIVTDGKSPIVVNGQ